ncbi:beta-alanyl-dopamine/carcinine hydrolase [Patella vulgata]|uniref:beta-alanyl-dopamine/carcinine hydrolase n=1 Tax=Patella vulgata TaxID=6465 RepID=UPI002180350D|nr:beta-alanyl-dopamine/carcinine hydrolase [Patella vulgata]
MASRQSPSLPVLYTTGTHYDVGYNTGVTFSNNIRQYVNSSKRICEKIKPYYDTQEGRELYDIFLKATEDSYPQYCRELRGISDGSGVPFEMLFLLNISPEVRRHLEREATPKVEADGCSDIFLNSPNLKLLVHNEDCSPLVKQYGYMLNTKIDDVEGKERFMAFCYPGILPGPAFAVNGDGMVITVDGLYPERVTLGAPPRYFVNRSLMRMTDIDSAKTLARNAGHGMAFGFCANISSIRNTEQSWALEIAPGHPNAGIQIHTIEEGTELNPNYYFRCNSYMHSTVEEEYDLCSTHRMLRAQELPAPKSLHDILNILGDTHHDLYPIFKTPRETDRGETVLTVSMNILNKTMNLYQGNPKYHSYPFMSLPLELYNEII